MESNPNITLSAKNGIFGVKVEEAQAALILIPAPWEVTVSYGGGTALGPQIIREASVQVDLYDRETGSPYESGIFMYPVDPQLLKMSSEGRKKAQTIISNLENGSQSAEGDAELTNQVDKSCMAFNDWLYSQCNDVLSREKKFGVIGGEHSVSLGAVRAIGEKYNGKYGILHFDAHADLRCAYEGFKYSHASIMYNILTSSFRPEKLVQVGIRDFCEEELDFIKNSGVKTFFDGDLKSRLFQGEAWHDLCCEIVAELPENVYVSFDVDALEPSLCPHTGTPVPGGMNFDQAIYLLRILALSGHKIIGFDLCEVGVGDYEPNAPEVQWDGNVGARVLYKLCGWTLRR